MTTEHTNLWIPIATSMLCGAYLSAKGEPAGPCINRARWEEARSREDIEAGIPARLRCDNCLGSDAKKETP